MTNPMLRRGVALLLAVLCSLTVMSSTQGCQLDKFVVYVASFQDMYTCTKPKRGTAPFVIDASTLVTRQSVRLDDCVHDGNKEECDELIEDFVNESDDNIFKYFATKMIESPDETCPCMTQYDSSLDECSAVIDQFTNYCNKFYWSDNNDDNKIVDGVKQCVTAVERACPNTDLRRSEGSFNSTFTCVTSHLLDLESECEAIFSTVLAGLYRACSVDLYELCAVESSSLSPSRALKCLMTHYSSISTSCRSQLDDLGANVIPCAKEAEVYCAGKYTPEDVVLCLTSSFSDYADSFSMECVDLLNGLSNCLPPDGEEPPPSQQNDAGDDDYTYVPSDDYTYVPSDDFSYYASGGGDDVDDYYAPPKPWPRDDDYGADDDQPRPKPKPRPDDDGAKPKPKPRPDDDRLRPNAVAGKSKLMYLHKNSDKQGGSTLYKTFNSHARLHNARDIGGPEDPPKKQPCWKPGDAGGGGSGGGKKKPPRGADDSVDDDAVDDGGNDDYASSSASDPHHSGKAHSRQSDDQGMRSTVLGAFAFFTAALLLGMLGLVWYKNNRSFDDLTVARVVEIIRTTLPQSLPRVPSLWAQAPNNRYVRASTSETGENENENVVEGIQLQTFESGGKADHARGGEVTATNVVVNPIYVSPATSELEV